MITYVRVILQQSLAMYPVRYMPSNDTLAVLNDGSWVTSYSGGKDSTTLVTWIEWLRRVGLVKVRTPRLVMSDTEVEYPFLQKTSELLLDVLRGCGWECVIVRPATCDKLYCQIFGRGLPPVHPAYKRLRWCTRSTKQKPMWGFTKAIDANTIQLTGIRWGESDSRDGKLKASGCAAGGECGLPEPGEGRYAPIITWRTCKVVEWLSGEVDPEVQQVLTDVHPITRDLMVAYNMKAGARGLWDDAPKFTSLRFGCIGCPAISQDKVLKSTRGRSDPRWAHLSRIYGIWTELYKPANRVVRVVGGKVRRGPIRMEVRKTYFAELLDIQAKSGVTLITPEDEAFIRGCWDRKVYPRGWTAEDESVALPDETMFAGCDKVG